MCLASWPERPGLLVDEEALLAALLNAPVAPEVTLVVVAVSSTFIEIRLLRPRWCMGVLLLDDDRGFLGSVEWGKGVRDFVVVRPNAIVESPSS